MIYKLSNIGTTITGVTPSTKNEAYYSNCVYPFITPAEVKNTRYCKTPTRFVSEKAYNDYSKRFISEHSVIVDCIGSDMGNACLTNELCLTNQQINAITDINSDIVIPEFLYYRLSVMKEYFHSIGMNGSTMPIISKSLFENIEIDIPDIDFQRHIVDILGTLDEKIEFLDKEIKLLEGQGELLYKNVFESPSIQSKKVDLAQVAVFQNGYSYSGDELCDLSTDCLATIKNFDRQGGFKIDGFKPIKVIGKIKSEMYAEMGDLLVAHTDLTQNADIIGNPVLLLNTSKYQRVVISMDLVKVKSNSLSNELLYYILKSEKFKGHALGYCSGTTVLHLSKKALQEYTFDMPIDKETVSRLKQQLSLIFDRIKIMLNEIEKLKELKLLYLQKFFG